LKEGARRKEPYYKHDGGIQKGPSREQLAGRCLKSTPWKSVPMKSTKGSGAASQANVHYVEKRIRVADSVTAAAKGCLLPRMS
ncbi:hypothetical protein, partial [Escherichia coli]|uniref:hypothetical protein n=1 Tax=Escherichia coli TaxID=562 RepID=UPI001BDC1BD4